ncbi:MAG: hypothetical protein NTW78_11685 [Campylobacterales bacterium]|nr:hypothetical protein [Campylobacterales bacterium]
MVAPVNILKSIVAKLDPDKAVFQTYFSWLLEASFIQFKLSLFVRFEVIIRLALSSSLNFSSLIDEASNVAPSVKCKCIVPVADVFALK